MKLRRTMKAQSPKKKEKERNNSNNNKRRGPRLSQALDVSFRNLEKRTLADIWESQGVCLDFQQKAIKNLAKLGIIFVTHGIPSE